MEHIIAGKDLVKTFGRGEEKATALHGLTLEISRAEFVAVMGASGSGKSTLLFALSGMDRIDSGSVFFDGTDLTRLAEKDLANIRRTKMGFVFQQPVMLKNLNLLDNIILPSMRENRRNTAAVVQRARSLMEKTGIAGLEKRDAAEVSGGQLQRAGICRALMNTPLMLFADEPTGALNSKAAGEIMDLFAGIHEGGTAILLVTHDAKVAARADRIVFMKDGIIACESRLNGPAGADMENRIEKIILMMKDVEV
jgi:putative ABC transport system ATP-binding protein